MSGRQLGQSPMAEADTVQSHGFEGGRAPRPPDFHRTPVERQSLAWLAVAAGEVGHGIERGGFLLGAAKGPPQGTGLSVAGDRVEARAVLDIDLARRRDGKLGFDPPPIFGSRLRQCLEADPIVPGGGMFRGGADLEPEAAGGFSAHDQRLWPVAIERAVDCGQALTLRIRTLDHHIDASLIHREAPPLSGGQLSPIAVVFAGRQLALERHIRCEPHSPRR